MARGSEIAKQIMMEYEKKKRYEEKRKRDNARKNENKK